MPSKLETASALHRRVFELLEEIYPQMTLFENFPLDVPISGRGTTTLYVDIVIKELKCAIECHGRQHFEYVEHFHGSRHGFAASQERDRAKAEKVMRAGYAYVIVRWDEEKTINRRKLLAKIMKALQER